MTPDAKIQIFAIKRGMINFRLNVNYYLPKYQNSIEKLRNANYGRLHKISDFADVVCGPFGSAIKNGDYLPKGIPLLRITNISPDGVLDYGDLKFISEKLSEKLHNYQVSCGDIVISQRGSLGLCAIVDDRYGTFNISANLIAIKNIKGHSSEFIRNFLNSSICKDFLAKAQSGQIQSKINTSDISEITVPFGLDEARLDQFISRGYEKYILKRKQAEELLCGMDKFVLNKLSIRIPRNKNLLCWPISINTLEEANSFNPEYFNPERLAVIKAIRNSSIPYYALKEKVSFSRDLIEAKSINCTFLGLASVQSNTGERVDSNEEASGGAFKYSVGDVLYCRLRPYLNKVFLPEDDGICSTEFHVMHPLDDSILSEYLAVIMRSKLVLLQAKHMMTGNTHPRISNDDVKDLVIPIPDIKKQRQIAQEYQKRIQKARQMRKDAEKEWQSARDQFEKELLGE